MDDVQKKIDELRGKIRSVNAESANVSRGMGGAVASMSSFAKVGKIAAVGVAVGLGAVAVAAVVVVRTVGTLVTGAFRIATAAARILWNVGVAAFRGIVGVAQTALGIVTKIGTVVGGGLIAGLVVGIKKTDEWTRSWIELERRSGAVAAQVKAVVGYAAGGVFSKGDIADAAKEFDRGGASLAQFAALLPLVKDTAAATGEKVAAVAKAIVGASRGQLQYAASIGFMTDENLQNEVAVRLYGKRLEQLSEEQKRMVALNAITAQMIQYRGAEAAALNTVSGAGVRLKNTFLEGLAVMADSFLSSSGLVAGMHELSDLISQNGGLFATVGTMLGEGFVWAREKVGEVVGFVMENMPAIVDTVGGIAAALGKGFEWAVGVATKLVGVVRDNLPSAIQVVAKAWSVVGSWLDRAVGQLQVFYLTAVGMKKELFGEGSWDEFKDGIVGAGQAAIGWLTEEFDKLITHVAGRIKEEVVAQLPAPVRYGIEAKDWFDETKKTVAVGSALALHKWRMSQPGYEPPEESRGKTFENTLKANYSVAQEEANKNPWSLSSIMPKPMPTDPNDAFVRESRSAAAQQRQGATLINQVNYQPGVNNIAFLQRQLGASGGIY